MKQTTLPVVELTVPGTAEYVSVVRLAVLGLCGRASLTYDEVEDLRLAVGEACATSVHRAVQAEYADPRITMEGIVEDHKITLEIRDNVPIAPNTDPEPMDAGEMSGDFDDQQFRFSLMQLLVDNVEILPAPGGGQLIRLEKICGAANEL